MHKLLIRMTVVVGLAALVSACAGARSSTRNVIATDPSADNSVPVVEQQSSYSVSGDVEVDVTDGTAFSASYNGMLGGDLDAFNVVLRPSGGSVPAVGVQGIPWDAEAGATYELAALPDDDQPTVYFQEVLTISRGVYARSVAGTLTITAIDDVRVSGEFEATLAPALTDGTILAGDSRYRVSGSFENVLLPDME